MQLLYSRRKFFPSFSFMQSFSSRRSVVHKVAGFIPNRYSLLLSYMILHIFTQTKKIEKSTLDLVWTKKTVAEKKDLNREENEGCSEEEA